MFHVDYLSVNPVWLISQLWTNLHSISNLWFHILYVCYF